MSIACRLKTASISNSPSPPPSPPIPSSRASTCSAPSGTAHGYIEHDGNDNLTIGAFRNTEIPDHAMEEKSAQDFVKIYSARDKTKRSYNADVGWVRICRALVDGEQAATFWAFYNILRVLTAEDFNNKADKAHCIFK